MEVAEKDGGLEAHIQLRSGGARRTKELKADGSRLAINMPQGQIWELTVSGDKFTGTQKRGEETTARLSGVRAPKLDRPMPARWTKSGAAVQREGPHRMGADPGASE